MIKLKLQHSLVLLAVITLSACSSNSDSEATNLQTNVFEESESSLVEPKSDDPFNTGAIEYLRIKHHMVECEGYQVSHCLLVQKEGSDEWTYFYDHIEGLDYQWGVDYEVLVQVEQVDLGLADTSNQQYTLLEVITQKNHESGDAFNYTSRKPNERITEIAPGEFSLLGNKSFTCTDQDCGALRSAITQNQSLLLSFQHNTNAAAPLILNAVLCSDASDSFVASCL